MRLRHRSILGAAMVALSFALVGCDTADTLDKLSDMIPFSDNKKPLPGERKEVFPQGVPGYPKACLPTWSRAISRPRRHRRPSRPQ